jgi:hypothetical protein
MKTEDEIAEVEFGKKEWRLQPEGTKKSIRASMHENAREVTLDFVKWLYKTQVDMSYLWNQYQNDKELAEVDARVERDCESWQDPNI